MAYARHPAARRWHSQLPGRLWAPLLRQYANAQLVVDTHTHRPPQRAVAVVWYIARLQVRERHPGGAKSLLTLSLI